MTDDNRVYDPMNYDILLDMATRIGGQYIAWADEAQNETEERHWLEQHRKMQQGVWAVDAFDDAAIEAKRKELRDLWAAMPEDAPQLAV